MAFALADLYVEISTKGLGGVSAQLSGLEKQMKDAATIMGGAEASLAKVGRAGTAAIGLITGSLAGLVAKGLQGQGVTQQVSLQFDILARNVAGLFRPEIEALAGTFKTLVNWFQNLDDAQRANLAGWIKGAAAGGLVAMILPKIISGVMGLGSAAKGLGVAISGALSSTGIGAFLPLIGEAIGKASAFAGAVGAVVMSTAAGRAGLAAFWQVIKPIVDGVASLGSMIMDYLNPILNQLGDGAMRIARVLGDGLTRAFAQIQSALTNVSPEFQRVVDLFIAMNEYAIKGAIILAERLASGFVLAANAVAIFVQSIANAIKGVMVLLQAVRPLAAILSAGQSERLALFLEGSAGASKRYSAPVGEAAGARRPFESTRTGSESITATFSRFQQAALKTDDVPRQQLHTLKSIDVGVRRVADVIARSTVSAIGV